MVKLGLFARLHAKKGQAAQLAQLLTSAVALANEEEQTVVWYALQFDADTFGIFDAFAGEEGRTAHLNGKIAAALMASADRLLASAPNIEKVQVLASK